MLSIGIVLSVSSIGLFCWLLYSLAAFALPVFTALWAGMWAYQCGAGCVGAVIFGSLAGTTTLVAGQIGFAFVRLTSVRIAIGLLYAIPAAFAGYSATLGISKLTIPSEAWQVAFSLLGTAVVGTVAWTRLTSRPDRTSVHR